MKAALNRKNVIALIIIVVLLFAIPLGLRLLQQQQIIKSRAAAGPIVFQGVNVSVQNGRQIFRLDDQGTPTVGLTLTSPFGAGSNIASNSSISPNNQLQNKINWVTKDISIQADDFYMILDGQKYKGDGVVEFDSIQGDIGFGLQGLIFYVVWSIEPTTGLWIMIMPVPNEKWAMPLLTSISPQSEIDYDNPIMSLGPNLPNIGSSYVINEFLVNGTNDQNETGTLYFKNLKITPFFDPSTRNNNPNLPSSVDLQNADLQSIIDSAN